MTDISDVVWTSRPSTPVVDVSVASSLPVPSSPGPCGIKEKERRSSRVVLAFTMKSITCQILSLTLLVTVVILAVSAVLLAIKPWKKLVPGEQKTDK